MQHSRFYAFVDCAMSSAVRWVDDTGSDWDPYVAFVFGSYGERMILGLCWIIVNFIWLCIYGCASVYRRRKTFIVRRPVLSRTERGWYWDLLGTMLILQWMNLHLSWGRARYWDCAGSRLILLCSKWFCIGQEAPARFVVIASLLFCCIYGFWVGWRVGTYICDILQSYGETMRVGFKYGLAEDCFQLVLNAVALVLGPYGDAVTHGWGEGHAKLTLCAHSTFACGLGPACGLCLACDLGPDGFANANLGMQITTCKIKTFMIAKTNVQVSYCKIMFAKTLVHHLRVICKFRIANNTCFCDCVSSHSSGTLTQAPIKPSYICLYLYEYL